MSETYDGWAIIEIMGHRVRAGRVVMDDTPLLRIDIPTADGEEITEYYGRGSIFSMRPCDEEVARDFAKAHGVRRPVRPVSYREDDAQRLAAPDDDDGDDESDYVDYDGSDGF